MLQNITLKKHRKTQKKTAKPNKIKLNIYLTLYTI